MASDTLAYGRGTSGSYAVLNHDNRLRNRVGLLPRGYEIAVLPPHALELHEPAPPVQSAGESPTSLTIDRYLELALADYFGLASDSPKQIRVTASPETRAASMDPWEAKNGRRIRLIEKKHDKGLNAKEAAELARLKREVSEHMQIVAPRPTEILDEIGSRIQLLMKRVAARKGKRA